ncbi:N-6 DNA methylase [Candidatus Uhrbacteria bacterium]|nr:N-6 DNA methylase [Candidatus Uhrbacteria bacterium]
MTIIMHAVLGVPYVPTPMNVVRTMVELVPFRGSETVYDLGCGDGRLLIAAKKTHPEIRAVGCEIVPTIWLLAVLRRFLSRTDVTLHLRSVFAEDLHDADVLFLYIMPFLIAKLMPKFRRELKTGTVIVCRSFPLPGLEPLTIQTLPWLGSTTSLFLYRWNQSAAKTHT